jgi:hypothetical protein
MRPTYEFTVRCEHGHTQTPLSVTADNPLDAIYAADVFGRFFLPLRRCETSVGCAGRVTVKLELPQTRPAVMVKN